MRGFVRVSQSGLGLLFVIALLAVCTSGCGYALAGRGSFLPADIRVVGIPQLQNQSTFFNVEQVLTEKVRAEFIGRGKYQVVPDATSVDALLTGAVTGISVTPIAFSDQQLASRYLFTMTMKVEFTDERTSKVLWSNDALVFREEYELSTRGTTAIEGASFLDQERSSFDRIATDVARSVVTSILEAF
jgi:hypothetical protein